MYCFRISIIYDNDDDENSDNNKPRTNENSCLKDKIVKEPDKSAPQQSTRTKRVNKKKPTKIILKENWRFIIMTATGGCFAVLCTLCKSSNIKCFKH